MSEPGMHFDNLSFNGGIQNFGGTNTNTQHNYPTLSPAELERHLATLREHCPDAEEADREIAVIRQAAVQPPTPEARHQIDGALRRLAANAGNARTATEALAAIGVVVAAHWPF